MNLADHLKALELSLLSPATRKDPEAVAALLAENFQEFSGSGRIYSRQQIIAALQQETPAAISLHDLQMTLLSPAAALVTYRSVKDQPSLSPSTALRSSIWIHEADARRMLFHQGTLVPAANHLAPTSSRTTS